MRAVFLNCGDHKLCWHFSVLKLQHFSIWELWEYEIFQLRPYNMFAVQTKMQKVPQQTRRTVTLSNRSAWGEWRGPWEVSRGLASCWPAWSLYSSDSTTCYPRWVSPACSTSRYNPPAALRSYVLLWSGNCGTTYFVIIESKDQASASFKKLTVAVSRHLLMQ